MTDDELVALYNRRLLPFITRMGGVVIGVDSAAGTCTFEYDISTDYCHSGDVVQGGFVTAMLDAAATHAVFAAYGGKVNNVSSLEIKTSFFEPARAGRLTAVGRLVRGGYKTAFMEADLFDAGGTLTARISTVGKLARKD